MIGCWGFLLIITSMPGVMLGAWKPPRLVIPRSEIAAERCRVAHVFPRRAGCRGSVTGGRISVDSGVLNPDQLTKDYGEDVGELWSRSRLRDRIDAIIIHEESEAKAGTHEEALALAPQTTRPISEATRRILRAMERGWHR
jgi:hypothetical protein